MTRLSHDETSGRGDHPVTKTTMTFIELLEAHSAGRADQLARVLSDAAWRERLTDDDALALLHGMSWSVAGERCSLGVWCRRAANWLRARPSRATFARQRGTKPADAHAAKESGRTALEEAQAKRAEAQALWTGGGDGSTPARDGVARSVTEMRALLFRVAAEDAGAESPAVTAFVMWAFDADDASIIEATGLPRDAILGQVQAGRLELLGRLEVGKQILLRRLLGERTVDIARDLGMERGAASMSLTRAVRRMNERLRELRIA